MTRTVEDEEDEDLRATVAAARGIRYPQERGWSTPTFACHRHPSSCVLACCCPCIQFGINQRSAFGASGTKWAFLWMIPLILLYATIQHLVPPQLSSPAHVELDVSEMSTADVIVSTVEKTIAKHVRKSHQQVTAHGKGGGDSQQLAAHGKGGGHHHGAASVMPPPPPPPSPKVKASSGSATSSRGMSRSTAYSYSLPAGMVLIGLVGAWRRSLLRARYGIGGTVLGDFVAHAFCWCCCIAKEAREIRHQAIEEALAEDPDEFGPG